MKPDNNIHAYLAQIRAGVNAIEQEAARLGDRVGSLQAGERSAVRPIEEIALEVGKTVWSDYYRMSNEHQEFCRRLIAAVDAERGSAEPVGYLDGRDRFFYANDPMYKDNHEGMSPVYRHPAPAIPEGWQPIETAPKTGRTILLGYFNSHGNWRAMRGQWFSQEEINETWEEPEDCDGLEGWYETSVEADDVPNCWLTEPTHWMPLPAAPQPGEKE